MDKVRLAQEFAYNQGAIGLIDLLDAERNYTLMMTEYYVAKTDLSIAYADLLMALGEDVVHRVLEDDFKAVEKTTSSRRAQ